MIAPPRLRLRPRRAAVLLVLVAGLAPVACGGAGGNATPSHPGGPQGRSERGPSSGGQEMSAADVSTVVAASRTLEASCPNLLTAGAPGNVAASVQSLITVEHRDGPRAIVEYGSLPEAMPMQDYLIWEGRVLARCGLRGPAAELQRAAARS